MNSIRDMTVGISFCPRSIAASFISFFAIFILDSVVSYRMAASSWSALLSSQASFDIFRLSLNSSFAPDVRLKASDTLISLISSSASISLVDLPCLVVSLNPTTKSASAPAASSRQALANSPAVMPATSANPYRSSDPVSIASWIRLMTREKAVPPACASMPRADSAVAIPRTSASDILACLAAPANRFAISRISFSVVAELLPSSTIADPARSKSFCDMPMMLANRARSVAPSWPMMFVATDRSAMTLVNSTMWSLSMPSCPAVSARAVSSTTLTGISFDISRKAWPILSSSSPVRLVVLRTPAMPDSKSIAAVTPAVPIARIGAVTFNVRFFPTVAILSPTACIFSPASWSFLPKMMCSSLMSLRAFS